MSHQVQIELFTNGRAILQKPIYAAANEVLLDVDWVEYEDDEAVDETTIHYNVRLLDVIKKDEANVGVHRDATGGKFEIYGQGLFGIHITSQHYNYSEWDQNGLVKVTFMGAAHPHRGQFMLTTKRQLRF